MTLACNLGSVLFASVVVFVSHQHLGHMETGNRTNRLVKPGIEPVTPGLQGKRFIHYTTTAPPLCFSSTKFIVVLFIDIRPLFSFCYTCYILFKVPAALTTNKYPYNLLYFRPNKKVNCFSGTAASVFKVPHYLIISKK